MARKAATITEYDQAVLHLDAPQLAPDVADPALVDRILAARLDLPGFAEQNLWIVDKDGVLVPLKLNRPQRLLWERGVQPLLLAGDPVRIAVLKARQMGFSTLIEALAYWRTSLWSSQNALVAAHRKESSNKIFRMFKRFHQHAPQDFKPCRQLSNRAEMLFSAPPRSAELGLDSHIATDTADNPDLGAGETLRVAHFSEFARFESASSTPMKDRMASLKQAVPMRPETFVFLETTAQGEGYFKDFWDDDTNGYAKFFVPWLAEEDYTLPAGVLADDLTARKDGPYGNEVDELLIVQDALRQWADKGDEEEWVRTEALRRMAWRRLMIDTQLERDLRLWDQEYPSTPEHAFGASSRGCFLPDALARIQRERAARSLVPEIYSLALPEGPGGRVDVVQDRHGSLRVYEPPTRKPNDRTRYAIGADVSEGVADGDFSVAQVIAFDPSESRSRLAATYRDRVDPAAFGAFLHWLSAWYHRAVVAPEVNGPGILTLDVLDGLGTPVYRRKVYDRFNATHTMEKGFRTTVATKPLLIETLRADVNYDRLDVWDDETLHEMKSFMIVQPRPGSQGRVQYTAPPGRHDDTVLALALARLARDYEEAVRPEDLPPPPGSFMAVLRAAQGRSIAREWGVR